MSDVQPNAGLDPVDFAANARLLLIEDRQNWRRFGHYWPLVKALLRKIYPDEELPLGSYQDESVVERMPKGEALTELLAKACEEYAFNATLGAGRMETEDDEGEVFLMQDPDMGA